MFSRFVAISKVSFLETVRQPIFGVLLICTTLTLLLNVSLAAFTMSDDNKLLLELGLSTLLLSGLFLASFSATGVLSREIENKTVLSVVSKPVSRQTFLLAKFTGLLGAMLLAHFINSLVFLLAQRHGVLQTTATPWDMPVLLLGGLGIIVPLLLAGFANYFYGKDFPLSALLLTTPCLTLAAVLVAFFDKKWNPIPFGSNYPGGQVMIACVLVLLFNIMLAAVATAASTRFGQIMTLSICVLFVCLATVADYAFGQYASQSQIAAWLYHVVPNLSPFWVIDGLFAEKAQTTVTVDYLGYSAIYSALVSTAFVSFGMAMFNRREVG